MSAALWLPGASRLDDGNHAPCDGGPAKAVAHITWDRNATAANPQPLVPYENLRSFFASGGVSNIAPHILWDPFTGRFTQFYPADSRSKSLVDLPGGTRTNRAGSVVIQIEAVFFPYCEVNGRVYARLRDTPCIGWEQLQSWVMSWGVPDRWPMGQPVQFVGERSERVWETQAGWYGHSQVPENDHTDPGSWPDFIEGVIHMGITAAEIAEATTKSLLGTAITGGVTDDMPAESVAAILSRTEEDGKENKAAIAALNQKIDALIAKLGK